MDNPGEVGVSMEDPKTKEELFSLAQAHIDEAKRLVKKAEGMEFCNHISANDPILTIEDKGKKVDRWSCDKCGELYWTERLEG
jgi:hypothetical protein